MDRFRFEFQLLDDAIEEERMIEMRQIRHDLHHLGDMMRGTSARIHASRDTLRDTEHHVVATDADTHESSALLSLAMRTKTRATQTMRWIAASACAIGGVAVLAILL